MAFPGIETLVRNMPMHIASLWAIFLYRCAVVYSFVLYPVLVWSVILPLCIHYRIASGYKAIFFIGKSVIYSFQGSHIG